MQKLSVAAPGHPSQSPGAAAVAQFFIPAATSLQELRPRTLKHDDIFGVFDHNGDVVGGPGSPEGLYYRDTRRLSHFYLTFDGARPMLLSSTLRDDNATLTCDLTNPDLLDKKGRLVFKHDLIHLRRSRFLWQRACFERIAIVNFDERRLRIRIAFSFAADFADIFEVRGTQREKRGELHAPEVNSNAVTLRYTGLDGITFETSLCFDPPPTKLTGSEAIFELDLAPRRTTLLFTEIRCDRPKHFDRRKFFTALRDARRASRTSSSRAASIASSNEIFNESIRRSMSDLYMLVTDTPEGPYPYAGIPWFSTVFGRDAMITALQMLWLDPAIARGVLRYLAAHQATEFNAATDAEPGKILHEVRHGEMAELGEVPFRCYYGSIDSTPLFVTLAGAYLTRTGDTDLMHDLWPNIAAALRWIDEYGDRDHDGFVEYGRRAAGGLINQGWKDSEDSISHADGRLAGAPIALVEVQAFVFSAWRAAAQIARCLGEHDRAAKLEARAEALRRQFDEAFFDPKLGTYALALDGDKQPCRVRSSNAGYALLTGIALPDRAPSVVATLMSRDTFCGWGLRTLAAREVRFNPMSYHNGSVWPHDNSLIAAGFARYGFRQEAARIFEGLFVASSYADLRRLPELFCGFPRQRGRGPTSYPVACEPQAWASGAPMLLLQSCLGLSFDNAAGTITFERPVLPDFLDEVVLRRLRLGGAAVDLRIRRAANEVMVTVLGRDGDIGVVTVS